MIDNIFVNEQSSILINGKNVIYIDPYDLNDSNNLKADYIFLTHPHYDHFSKKDIEKIVTDKTIFIIPKSMKNDFNEKNVCLVDINQKIKIDDMEIETYPAYNLNKPYHSKENNWLGYVISIDNERIYTCGDTDYLEEFNNIKCDILLVPIGGTYTMDYIDASKLTNKICPKYVIPIHYGTIVGKKDLFDKFKALINNNIQVVKKLV